MQYSWMGDFVTWSISFLLSISLILWSGLQSKEVYSCWTCEQNTGWNTYIYIDMIYVAQGDGVIKEKW